MQHKPHTDYVIFTDSCSDLTVEQIKTMGVSVIPLSVELEGKSYFNYPDERDISFQTFYNMLREKLVAKTSMVGIGQFMEAFEPTLREGKGIVRINSMNLETYGPKLANMMIKEPLILASEFAGKVDIDIFVQGGGWHSQADAIRLVVARALVQYSGSKALKQKFLEYDRHLLVSDIRRAERSKPNDSKPRAARQKSYR